MKTKYSLSFWSFVVTLSMIIAVSAYAQSPKTCGTTEATAKALQQYPSALMYEQQLEDFTENWVATHKQNKTADEQVYVIPIVFHIIHNYGAENISDAQILDQVEILNRDFRKRNADTSDVVSDFKSLIADARIEFRLAQIDGDGFCTNGIERIFSYETYVGGDDAKLNQWPQHKYLNVWVVNSMENGVAGYAYFPSYAAVDPKVDGIIILSDYIGSIGTGSTYNSRALTHEIGHYLNLMHPWGGSNSPGVACGDDGVTDTPETMGWTYCPSASASKVCDTVVENFQNYMDYSYCSKMYTSGQKDRMHATLNNNIAYRNNLWTEANLKTTGTDSGYTQTCVPEADFYADKYLVCEGSSVTFTDVSWKGSVANRIWSFSSGTPSSTTAQSVDVTFNAAGWQEVSLTASNAAGSDTKTESAYVYVSSLTADYTAPYSEDFGSETNFNTKWITANKDKNSSEWDYAQGVGYYGSSLVMKAYESRPEDTDDLITPSIDLSGMSSIYLNFKYACATSAFSSADMTDALKIYVSTNCGETWSLRGTISGTDLVNNGNWSTYFIPTTTSVWSDHSIKIASTYADPNVRFKFEFSSGGHANNLYLDNINISTISGIPSENDDSNYSFDIYPNPSKDNVTFKMDLDSKQYADIQLVNSLGQHLENIYAGYLSAGENKLTIDISILPTGIYTMCLKIGDAMYQKKLIKISE